MDNSSKKTGFTLPEVLITLMIIGIVASITIPSIVNDIKQKDLATLEKKARVVINSALTMMATDNGGSIDGVNLNQQLGSYLKTSRNCLKNGSYNCWHDNNVVKIAQKKGTTDLTHKNVLGRTTGSIVTLDGMYLRMSGTVNCNKGTVVSTDPDACYSKYDYTNGYCGEYYVDLNGKRGPNIWGQDIRHFNLWSNGKIYFASDKGQPKRWDRTENLNKYRQEDFEIGGVCYDTNDYTAENYW